MPYTTTADGCKIHYQSHGESTNPALMLGYPWNDGIAAMIAEDLGEDGGFERLKADNDRLVAGLAERYRVIQMDYPRGIGATDLPKESDLQPQTVAEDYVAVADHAGIGQFVAVGYSWSANAALQVASRTDRCAGLVIGGWPPLNGPYQELFQSLNRQLESAAGPIAATGFIKMICNYYQAVLESWNEEEEVTALTGPRVSFFGGLDVGAPEFGIPVEIADLTRSRQAELERLGWKVLELADHDHSSIPPDLIASIVCEGLEKHTW